MAAIADGLASSGAKGDEIQAVAGHLADTESLVALKDLINSLGSDNIALDQIGGHAPPVHGVDVRSNYLFNSTIPGVEAADVILLVGTNPRHEAAVLNSRIRKSWLHTGLEVGYVGERADTTYGYDYLGEGLKALSEFIGGKGAFAAKFKAAKKPLIIVGSALAEQADGAAAYNALAKFVDTNKDKLITPEWNGLSILQRVRIPLSAGSTLSLGLTLFICRSLLVLRLMTSDSSHRRRPPQQSLSSSISLMQMRWIQRQSQRTLSLYTKAITATSVHNLPMSVCLLQRTQRNRLLG